MQQQAQMPVSGHSMVSSSEVNGTNVFSTAGDLLGHIDHLMIDKASGQISCAVMRFGGFFGLGAGQHPIPWKKLHYDVARGGYVTDLTAAQVASAPARPEDWQANRDFLRRSYDYYGVPPFWL
ncbi:MAG: PRC-barrel domain-containing protein [Paracoccaceae bacterium]